MTQDQPLRLNFDADTEVDVFAYYETRARQVAYYGYKWLRELTPFNGGFITYFTRANRLYASFYIVASMRGRGYSTEALHIISGIPVLTLPDCNIDQFLTSKGVVHVCPRDIHITPEYKLIESHYGDKRAKRSGVLLMNHIDEGLTIMARCGASKVAKQAFALHPLIQDDDSLAENIRKVVACAHPMALVHALEYRSFANAYLSHKTVDTIELGPLPGVRDMLIADKIQNRKDFELYHKGTHPRSDILDAYFKRWLDRLNITETEYQHHVHSL